MAVSCPVDQLVEALTEAAEKPLRIVGSGGSFSCAVFAALLHENYTRHSGKAVTPLDLLRAPALFESGVLCLTASGRNRDICAAFEKAAREETRPLVGFSLAAASPFTALGAKYGYSKIVPFILPFAADGFLAVNSLFATAILLTRAYRQIGRVASSLPPRLTDLLKLAAWPDLFENERICWTEMLSRRTISVLHSPFLISATIDLESRFVEGALGNIQSADWRNFGHGRHHWMARRGNETGVLALVSDIDRDLAKRTLDLIPPTISRVVATFSGPDDEQALCALYLALHLAEIAGDLAGIDPGKPGVPDFGRKLYRLGPSSPRPAPQEAPHEAAIRRKAIARVGWSNQKHHQSVEAAFHHLRECWAQSGARAIIFDYDGTLCDRRRRFDPLETEISAHITRLAIAGVAIGIATGRGRSAGRALQAAVPKELWPSILVGYYNGSIVLPLENLDLKAEQVPGDRAKIIAARLIEEGVDESLIEIRRSQISLRLPLGGCPERLVPHVAEVVTSVDPDARVCCSSHSVDVVLDGHSKLAVLDAMCRGRTPELDVTLRFGDKGRWPGNDFKLLQDPFGFSVDEVSDDLHSCWNLAPAGILGVQAMLYYMLRLTVDSSSRARLQI
jgi:hypothetical protein